MLRNHVIILRFLVLVMQITILLGRISFARQFLVYYSLEELTQDNVNVCLKSGNSLIAIYKPTSKSQLLVDSFFIGCREIANVYSDYVEISKN